MKKAFIRTIALLLCVVIMAATFTACGNKQDSESIDAVVDAAVKAALDAAVVPTVVTIEVDGKQIAVEDAANMSLQQMLDQANITLNDGDLISVPPYQTMSGNISVRVIRNYIVTIVVEGETPEESVRYVVAVNGGTVADALTEAGVKLEENQVTDQELEKALEKDMVITVKTEKTEEEAEETEPTEEAKTTSTSSSSNNTSSSSRPSTSKPATPKPTQPKPTEPKPTTPSKTVVSKVKYEDCDGSGHGVWVITYSDGSQEEVPF